MQTITSIDDAVALVGHELGVSGWKEIDQQRINDFADVTEDRQWIHTDVERAMAAAVERFRFPTTRALTIVIDTCCTCDATTAVAADGQRIGRTPTSSSRVSISAGSA